MLTYFIFEIIFFSITKLTLVNPCRYLKMEPWYAMDGVKTTDSFVWFSAAPSTV